MALIFPSPTLVAETRIAVTNPASFTYLDIKPSTPGNSLYVIVGFVGDGGYVNAIFSEPGGYSWTINPTYYDPTASILGAELWAYTPPASINALSIEILSHSTPVSLALIRVLEFDQAGTIADSGSNNATTGSSTSPNSGSQTALANDFFIGVIFTDSDSDVISALPTDFLPIIADFPAGGCVLSIAFVPIALAGTADFSATLAVSADWVAMLSCFKGATATALGSGAYCSADCFLNVPSLAVADDGTWTYSPTGYIHGTLQALTYSPALSLWLAAGWQEWIPEGTPPNTSGLAKQCLATSPDLVTWTLRATPADPGYYQNGWISSVIWAPSPISLFIAVGYTAMSLTLLMTSPDGINWTERSIGPDVDFPGDLGYSSDLGQLIAIGNPVGGSITAVVSTDGITWTDMSSGSADFPPSLTGGAPIFSSHPVWSHALLKWLWLASYGGGSLYATPTSSFPIILSSTDGTHWTELSSTSWPQLTTLLAAYPGDTDYFAFQFFSGIAYSDSLAVIVVSCAGSWEARETASPYTVYNSGSFGILMSLDGGSTWNYEAAALVGSCSGVAWSPTLALFAVSGYGLGTYQILTSPDGYSWTVRSSIFNSGGTPQGIIWEPSTAQFVVFGSGFDTTQPHILVTSPDGITWTEHNTPYDGSAAIIPRGPLVTSVYCDKGGPGHIPTVSSSVGANPHPGPTSDFF